MARKRKGEIVNGWINLDKPAGLTSTQAMAKVRRIFSAQKAGHAGTLDPLATGVLPIALGEATKTIPFIQDGLKTYTFTIKWGESRDTDDSEGDIIATSDIRPTQKEIEKFLPKYTGRIQQTPPQFSAVKIDGQRAYDLARAGETVDIKSREVFIKELEILPPTHSLPPLGGGIKGGGADTMQSTNFRMTCGKGTYVRALARDLAKDLNTCGHISKLRREGVGPFTAKAAISLDKLEELGLNAALNDAILPLETALDDIPALALREDETAKLRNGQTLAFISRPDVTRLEDAGLVIDKNCRDAVALYKGKPIALIEVSGVNIKPVRVLNL